MAGKGENLILIGMPGVGKSTIGLLLAKELVKTFVDTDLLIQAREERALQDIIFEADYLHLRQIEEAILLGLSGKNQVIATGGSAVHSEAGMNYLKSMGQLVFLKLPMEDILGRISNPDTRGIAKPKSQSFEQMFAERQPLYHAHAGITIDCRGKTPAEIVSEIIFEEGEYFAEKDA